MPSIGINILPFWVKFGNFPPFWSFFFTWFKYQCIVYQIAWFAFFFLSQPSNIFCESHEDRNHLCYVPIYLFFSFCCSFFLLGTPRIFPFIISFLLEELLFWKSLRECLLAKNSFSFTLFENGFISVHSWRIILMKMELVIDTYFPPQHLKNVMSLPLAFMVSDKKYKLVFLHGYIFWYFFYNSFRSAFFVLSWNWAYARWLFIIVP